MSKQGVKKAHNAMIDKRLKRAVKALYHNATLHYPDAPKELVHLVGGDKWKRFCA